MGQDLFGSLLGGGQEQQSHVPFATPQAQQSQQDPLAMQQPSPFFGQNAPFGGRTNAINAQKNVS